ncbi:hypothetical protein C8J56DRAFT_1161830 [Mycena floridula]|nr:hypothetical protein C8J56DRAFT_1161830 [Mycena floridula]
MFFDCFWKGVMSTFETLPDDIILSILLYLGIEDTFNLRATCRSLSMLTRHRTVWLDLLERTVHEPNIPIAVSDKEDTMEGQVVSALQTHINFTSPSPNPSSRRRIPVRGVQEAKFQTNGCVLLRTRFGVELWNGTKCMARRDCGSVAFNDADETTACLRSGVIEILGFDCTVLAGIELRISALLVFSGRRILSRDKQGRICVWDWTTPKPLFLKVAAGLIIGAVLHGNYTVILSAPRTLTLYDSTGNSAAVHHFPHAISASTIRTSPTGTIHLLIRPIVAQWNANILEHYTISVDGSNRLNPILRHSLAAPVRIAMPTPMTLGRFGTAVWIDGHVEDYFEIQGVVRGQRAAGLKLGPGEERADGLPTSARSIYAVQQSERWTGIAIDEVGAQIAMISSDEVEVVSFGLEGAS